MTVVEADVLARPKVATESAPKHDSLSLWTRIEGVLDRLGDRLNPILVKEARQAMKSRQFVVTFSLLLVFGWLWTLLFISFGVPAIFHAPVGAGVLAGYYLVLSVPLLIVVPYAAFRSLAAEREDGTYELLSITTLSARQIVLGKLGSAVLQMMVYYSALAPCIAFTYLLRGIDIITIGLFLAYSFLASLLLCFFGLMMATVTRQRHWQVLVSVVLVMGLLVFAFIWNFSFLGFIFNNGTLPLDSPDFWMANLCLISFYVPAVTLLLFLAAGQISFASENRSTPIRVVLIVPQVCLVGWMVYYWIQFAVGETLFLWVALAALYWALAGAFLTGETAQLSPRARRQLPQSFLGRMLLTWFNPGSGTGYIFAMLNLLTVMAAGWAAVGYGYVTGYEHLPDMDEWFGFTIGLTGYVMAYVGGVRLAVVAVRRLVAVGLFATVLSQVIVALAGILIPLLIQALLSWGDETTFVYSLLQLPNFVWTLYEVVNTSAFGGWELALIVASVGGVIFLINLLVAAREVEHVRQAAPLRVIEDEQALHPEARMPRKKNPWDEAVAGEA